MKKPRACDSTGGAVVEFALVLPVLVILIVGMIEFSVLFYNKQVITNASREGARAGIVQVNPRVTQAAIISIVNSYAANNLITFGAVGPPMTTVSSTPGQAAGTNLTVIVTYNYGFLVAPRFIPGLPNPITLTAQTVMRYE